MPLDALLQLPVDLLINVLLLSLLLFSLALTFLLLTLQLLLLPKVVLVAVLQQGVEVPLPKHPDVFAQIHKVSRRSHHLKSFLGFGVDGELVVGGKELIGVGTLQEFRELSLQVHPLAFLITVPKLIGLFLDQSLQAGYFVLAFVVLFDVFEGEFGVEELGVDSVEVLIALTHHKDLRRLRPRGLWLCRFNFVEEVVQYEEE
mmetsp:Transcript_20614/g.19592  ORF Transcript_20614/g.19592 Transcript_20614/m.19592 type:complete len:202 (-) Transcript_20614:82-687(-)